MSRRFSGHQWIWRLMAAPVLGAMYLLLEAGGADASLFVAPGPAFPERVTVGQPAAAQLGISNVSTPPESTSSLAVNVGQIDLVPSCRVGIVDCGGGVEAGVFRISATASAGSGPSSCRGTWAVSEVSGGVFRFVPPGGEGSLQLRLGEVCVVDYTVTALRLPVYDTEPASGVQTNQVLSVTAQLASTSVRVATPDQTTVTAPSRRAQPVADYDGDGKADLAIFRPSRGTWYIDRSSAGDLQQAWGTAGDVPVLGDYDGDGKTDVAVFRPGDRVSTWYISGSAGMRTEAQWGAPGEIPVPGDYDGDGRTDIAVFRPGDWISMWYVDASSGADVSQAWGVPGDIPVPADYDGDGRVELAVYRPSQGTWFVRSPSGGVITEAWGVPGDVPLPADYDGDGRADLAVYRPSQGAWFVRQTTGGTLVQAWGVAGDIPVPGDYNGDGRVDLTVFRPSQGLWFSRLGGTTVSTQWGISTDVIAALPPALRMP